MTSTSETVAFQAETKELLKLVIHSLYTHKEIFLRELISNASDALDKLRVLGLTQPELLKDAGEPGIQLALDSDKRILCVIDNGIGMSREEVVDNLGTIARSGTKDFVAAMKQARDGDAPAPELIGQFGVGFYSSFMVADEVVVETRRAGEEQGTRWSSRAEGDYEIESVDKPSAGTTVMLHLKPSEEGQADMAKEWTIRELVKRYSDFIEYPIQMEVGEGDERKTETLNSRKPLWTRARSDVEDKEYAEFYRHLTHDWTEPLETIHFKAEGATEYTALLYVPGQRSMDLFDSKNQKARIQLYVRRVFVMADSEDILPIWLRFVRGVVDSADLPLNVSRETLQHASQMGRIRKRLTRKILDALGKMLADRREDYVKFWSAFGNVFKEGLYYEDEQREEVARLSLWSSTLGEEPTSLPEYLERMPVKQEEIYVLLCSSRAAGLRSPHLEALTKKGCEVLFLTEPVDEFVLQRLSEFQGKKVRQIDKGEVDLEESEEKEQREQREKELESLLESVRKALFERVEDVRFSHRLTESPACLVAGENDMSPAMERFLRDSGQLVPERKRVLELNATHPLVVRMRALSEKDADFARFGDYCELLFGQALIAEGSNLPDPAKFTQLVTELMLKE